MLMGIFLVLLSALAGLVAGFIARLVDNLDANNSKSSKDSKGSKDSKNAWAKKIDILPSELSVLIVLAAILFGVILMAALGVKFYFGIFILGVGVGFFDKLALRGLRVFIAKVSDVFSPKK